MKHINNSGSLAMRSLPSKQAGLSLIELMVASVIGLFILAGAVTVFSGNSASSKLSNGMAKIQDSGRVTLDILSNSIRMAGFEGCKSDSKDSPVVLASTAPVINFPNTALWGAEISTVGWAPAKPADLNNIANAEPGTDVIYLQHGSGRTTNLAANMTGSTDTSIALVNNPDQLNIGDMVMISDCQDSNIFRTSDVSNDTPANGNTTLTYGASVNSQGNLTETFQGTGDLASTPLRVMRFISTAYYVAESGRTTGAGDPILSLFSVDTTSIDTSTNQIGTSVELVEGVENIQILYGELIPSSRDIRYVTANNVGQMNNVVSVQIGVLIATPDYVTNSNDDRTYSIAGTTIGPPGDTTADANHLGDRRMRAAFNTTIQLRNRNNLL